LADTFRKKHFVRLQIDNSLKIQKPRLIQNIFRKVVIFDLLARFVFLKDLSCSSNIDKKIRQNVKLYEKKSNFIAFQLKHRL